jgi:LPXTG-motif cell wall-anchored protein
MCSFIIDHVLAQVAVPDSGPTGLLLGLGLLSLGIAARFLKNRKK